MKEHLSDQEMEAYRRRTAPPEQMLAVSDHLGTCDECYRRFGSSAEIRLVYEFFNRDLEAALRGDGGSLWERIVAPLRRPRLRIAVELACFAVLFLVGLWITTSRLRSYVGDLESRISRLEKTNGELRQQAEAAAGPKETPAAPALELRDGNLRITLDKGGVLRGLAGLSADFERLATEALKTGRVTTPPVPSTSRGRTGILLGNVDRGAGFEVLSPVATVVEDVRPAFRWRALAGASSYVVLMRDEVSGEEIESPPVSGAEWTPDKPLVQGRTYAWMVEASAGEERYRAPAQDKPFACFRVLDAQQAREIALARKEWGGSHLMMGLLYARAGLRYEAAREFKALASANPASTVAKSLLSSVEPPRAPSLIR